MGRNSKNNNKIITNNKISHMMIKKNKQINKEDNLNNLDDRMREQEIIKKRVLRLK